MTPTQLAYRRSLRLIKLEIALTAALFAMPIMNVFYAKEIGMDYAQVGIAQAVFTLALIAMNIPTGWIADRFRYGRKGCNIAGDVVAAIGFGYYALADTFVDIIVAEMLVGIGLAFSGGADAALIRAYCIGLGLDQTRVRAGIHALRTGAEMGAVVIGGIIGAHNLRLAIALGVATYAAGAVISMFLIEAGEHHDGKDAHGQQQHPVRGMWGTVKYTLHGHKQLAWSVAAYAFGREMTHPVVWVLTPLMLVAGIPPALLGVGWAANLFCALLGSLAARHWAPSLRESQRLSVGLIVFVAGASVLSVHVSLGTIVLFGCFGLTRGWMAPIIEPIVQRHAPDALQSSVVSVAMTTGNVLYMILVVSFGFLADIDERLSVAASLVLFAPALLLVIAKLRVYERR